MKYIHDSLDYSMRQIRLLMLAPADNMETDIHCSLQTVDFQDQPEYEALSYTWGDTSQKCIIYLNDYSFEATPNLDLALRHLRNSSMPRSLWIDAICINQANLKERSHQVAQMRDIYSNASQVLVWLGESDKDIDEVMELLVRSEENSDDFNPLREKSKDTVNPGLDKLFQKPWFSRLWVVQELAVAKNDPLVGCGHTWVSWTGFYQTLATLDLQRVDERPDYLLSTKLGSLFELRDMRNAYRGSSQANQVTLQDLLASTSDRDATDPRDQIYAILGLVSDVGDGPLLPDYEQPVGLAYQKVMVDVFKSSGGLELLISAAGERKLDLPSWCVDLSRIGWNKQTAQLGWYPFLYLGSGGASGPVLRSDVVHDPENGVLTLTGTVIGSIEEIIMPSSKLSGSEKGPADRSIFEKLMHDELLSGIQDEIREFLVDAPRDLSNLLMNRPAIPEYAIATTDTGYIASAAHAVQKEDLLCILFGCRLPAVLRPSSDTCQLITFTYTHNVMKGEYVANVDGVKRQEFSLR